MSQQPPPRQVTTLNIEIPAGLEPIYANMVRISHSPSDLSLDFVRALPLVNQLNVLARIIMSPVGAKMFYRALGDNLARYEAAFGEIHLPGNSSLADDLFRSIHPNDPNTPPNPNNPTPPKA